MNYKDLLAFTEAYKKVKEKKKMDPVDDKELDKDYDDRDDKDIDNDGDTDSSDEYLHKRRKAISKKKDEEETVEEKKDCGKPKSYGMRAKLEKVKAYEGKTYAERTKGATKPEGLLDKESPEGEEFIKKHSKEEDDTREKSLSDMDKANGAGKQAPARRGDQLDNGDKKPVK